MAGTAPCGTPIDLAASYRVTITSAHPQVRIRTSRRRRRIASRASSETRALARRPPARAAVGIRRWSTACA